jgi:hypothetical protein
MYVDGNSKLIRIFVHLANGYGARNWQQRWASGQILGINERPAYGYFRAAEDGCSIVYSEDMKENGLQKLFRLGIRFLLGFDFVHAWRNRKGIFESDVVWTHTESQHLAILSLFRILFWKHRPKLIAQSVWLFDRWQRFGLMRRWLYSALLSKADILTVHSP